MVVVAAVLGVMNLVAVPVLVWRGRLLEAVLAAGWARASYWFAAGAFRRTPWGAAVDVDPLPGPPPLSDRQVRHDAVAAGLAAIAVVLALAFQAIDGEWVG